MFRRIADRLVLVPSTNPISFEHQRRVWVESELGQIEVLVRDIQSRPAADGQEGQSQQNELLVLKFPGAGGRAEKSSPHPMEAWPNFGGAIWTVNPPGYGKSPGRASIQNLAATAEAVFEEATRCHENATVLICANSLGNLPALYLAARYPERIYALLLRNPPPLREVIIGRHPWWMTWGVGYPIATGVPSELNTIKNAERAKARAVFVMSELDRVVPPRFQQRIYDNYSAPKQRLVAQGAGHAEPIPESQLEEYRDLLHWLLEPIHDGATK